VKKSISQKDQIDNQKVESRDRYRRVYREKSDPLWGSGTDPEIF